MKLLLPALDIKPNHGFKLELDIFKRKEFGERLANLIENANDHPVIALDSGWGEGKSTFIHMWRGYIENERDSKLKTIYFDAFNGTEHPTNFNGQTKILKAESNVTPGVLYHIKLVIADQGNNLYDSAIFLGGGSFSVETDLGPDRLIATENPLCENETLTLDATTPNAVGYKWYRNNTLITGAIQPSYTTNQAGNYHLVISYGVCSVTSNTVNLEQNSITANLNLASGLPMKYASFVVTCEESSKPSIDGQAAN